MSKKMTVMLGSPRKQSVSSDAAEQIMTAANRAGFDIVEYNVNNMEVAGCQGCGMCREKGTDCIIEDDFSEYLKDLSASDVLIVTAPNYYSHIAGPMVTFMNRHYCLFDKDRKPRLQKKIKVFGIFSQGASAPREEYEQAYDWYMSIFEKLGMENLGHITIGGNTDQDAVHKELSKLGETL